METLRETQAARIRALQTRGWWQPDLARCRCIERAEKVVFLGGTGTGKSHLGIALGIAACMQSCKVRFKTAADLVNELIEARDERMLSKLVTRHPTRDASDATQSHSPLNCRPSIR